MHRSHDWTKKAPKPWEVLQRFFAELNGWMKLLWSERTSTSFGKKISQLLALKCGTWKMVVIIVQTESNLYDLTVVHALVEMKLKKFVIRLHNEAIMCLFDRTENRINILCSSLRQGSEVRNIRMHQLTFLTQTTKRSYSQFRGRRRNGKTNTKKNLKSDLCLKIWSPLENRATTSASKPVSILRDITKKDHPFW